MDEHRLIDLPAHGTVGLAEYGEAGGEPVLFFHGWPGSRLQGRYAHRAARELGVRLLAIDRPGCGLSEHRPRRTLADFPPLVAALAAHLELDAFRFMAVSGGGPYALACVAALPERVRAALLVCAAPPPEVLLANTGLPPGMRLLRMLHLRVPGAVRLVFGALAWGATRLPLQQLVGLWALGLPASDRTILADRRIRTAVADSTREAFRGGAAGPLRDIEVLLMAWGLDLDALRRPVAIGYGSEDTVTPPRLCAPVFEGRSGMTVRIWPGEGHYSLPLGHASRALRELLDLGG
jgi:pimeloyl-ACP methyl ester carboxylesterase